MGPAVLLERGEGPSRRVRVETRVTEESQLEAFQSAENLVFLIEGGDGQLVSPPPRRRGEGQRVVAKEILSQRTTRPSRRETKNEEQSDKDEFHCQRDLFHCRMIGSKRRRRCSFLLPSVSTGEGERERRVNLFDLKNNLIRWKCYFDLRFSLSLSPSPRADQQTTNPSFDSLSRPSSSSDA